VLATFRVEWQEKRKKMPSIGESKIGDKRGQVAQSVKVGSDVFQMAQTRLGRNQVGPWHTSANRLGPRVFPEKTKGEHQRVRTRWVHYGKTW